MTYCKLHILLSIKFTLFTFSFTISQAPKKCKREGVSRCESTTARTEREKSKAFTTPRN